jgi:hypothetical protein
MLDRQYVGIANEEMQNGQCNEAVQTVLLMRFGCLNLFFFFFGVMSTITCAAISHACVGFIKAEAKG